MLPGRTFLIAYLKVALIAAFVMRALIPPGYMIETAAAEGVKIVLCSAHGAIEARLDPKTGEITYDEAPAKKAPAGDQPCAFAAIAKLAPPSSLASLPLPPTRTTHAPHSTHELTPGRGLVAPPPPATGPPTSVA
jgi:hypothetical protein